MFIDMSTPCFYFIQIPFFAQQTGWAEPFFILAPSKSHNPIEDDFRGLRDQTYLHQWAIDLFLLHAEYAIYSCKAGTIFTVCFFFIYSSEICALGHCIFQTQTSISEQELFFVQQISPPFIHYSRRVVERALLLKRIKDDLISYDWCQPNTHCNSFSPVPNHFTPAARVHLCCTKAFGLQNNWICVAVANHASSVPVLPTWFMKI